MDHFAGLDVSVRVTSVCIVDDAGKIVREVKVASEPEAIVQMMRVGLYRPVHVKTLRSQKLRMLLTRRKLLQSKAIAIENDLRGTLRALAEAELAVVCVETRHIQAVLKAQINQDGPQRCARQLLAVLKNPAYHFKRIGLEAGPLSQWLFGVSATTRGSRAHLSISLDAAVAACSFEGAAYSSRLFH